MILMCTKVHDTERKNEMKTKEQYGLTDEQVEREIARLNESPYVALARREQRLKYRQRQRLYTLRALEKRGKALMDAGITRDVLDAAYSDVADDEGACDE